MFEYLIPESIFCLIFTLVLFSKYAKKEVSLLVKLITIIVWYFSFVTVFIIPNDISLIKDNPELESQIKIKAVQIIYRIIYWTIFVLSWVVLPLLTEYEASGQLKPSARLKEAIKKNMIFILGSLGVGTGIIIYMIATKQLTFSNISGFLIDLSNAWGLLLVIFFLGYGVVIAPKFIVRLSNYEYRIKYLEWKAGEIEDIMLISLSDLRSLRNKIQATNFNKTQIEDKEKIDEIIDEIMKEFKRYNIQPGPYSSDELPIKNIKDFIEVRRSIKHSVNNYTRLQCEKNEVYCEWQFLQRLLSKEPSASNGPNTFYKHVYLFYRPIFLIALAFCIIVLSLILILSEVTLFLKSSFCLFGMLITMSSNVLVLHLCSLIPLALLFYLSFYALFNLKVSGYYAMYPNGQTDASSLLFISTAMCNISIPLCINFIQMIKFNNKKTILELNYGVCASRLPLNKQFVIFYPALLILLIVLHYFEVFQKVGSYLGFYSFGLKQSYDEEKIADGREFLLKKQKEVNVAEKVEIAS